uniref:Uncharacterized protein n=1 Tax=Oryza glumipatula TaxID=40148 RepID=A0A0E0A843_9ORYZ
MPGDRGDVLTEYKSVKHKSLFILEMKWIDAFLVVIHKGLLSEVTTAVDHIVAMFELQLLEKKVYAQFIMQLQLHEAIQDDLSAYKKRNIADRQHASKIRMLRRGNCYLYQETSNTGSWWRWHLTVLCIGLGKSRMLRRGDC